METIKIYRAGEVVAESLVDADIAASQGHYRWQLNDGYPWRTTTNGRSVFLHHEVLGKRDGFQVDHKDGNRLNNTRANLRYATHQQNQWNRSKAQRNKTGYKGVFHFKGNKTNPYRANIQGEYLGFFPTPEAAAHAYDCAAQQRYGEFAHYNLPHLLLQCPVDRAS